MFTSCGTGSGGSTGTMTVEMTDAPIDPGVDGYQSQTVHDVQITVEETNDIGTVDLTSGGTQ